VAAEPEGRVVAVPVEEGEAVRGGETVLARLEPVWTEIDLEAARARRRREKARLEEAQAELERARVDLAYLESLEAQGSARPREVRKARTERDAGQARLKQARAALDEAKSALRRIQTRKRKLTVKAPFDGTITELHTEVGEWVSRGGPIAELVSRGTVEAVLETPQRLVNELEVGQRVQVRVDPLKAHFPGEVHGIVPRGDRSARTFPVHVRLDDEGGALKPGMSATARIPTGAPKPVRTVPRDAVLRTDGAPTVWALREEQAQPLAVEVLFATAERMAVRPEGEAALAPDTPVVIEGAEPLRPGQDVIVAGEGSPRRPEEKP
jgi:RND family efflux transporter MFP subunit